MRRPPIRQVAITRSYLTTRFERPLPARTEHVERLIGSIRRECLDHIIIWNAAHLRRVLAAYADYYNNDRMHLALGKNSPHPRTVEAAGRILAEPVLGGLHHRYRRKPKN